MRFEAVNVKDFVGYKETKIQQVLNDFKNSEIAVAEVTIDNGEYSNISSAYSALNSGIKRLKHGNIGVKVKNKKLYLINQVLYESALKE